METVELRSNNLYRVGEIVQFDDGDLLLLREPISWQATAQDKFITMQGDTLLDKLASLQYSASVEDASKLWWIIADVNGIENPLDLSEIIGKEILVPNILSVLLSLD